MPWKESEAVPEGNGPVPQQEEFGFGQPTLVDVYRKIKEVWDRKMDEIRRLLEQHLANLEQDARQPRLAMEADGPADTKPRERTEGAAKAVQAMHVDSFSASRIDPGPKTTSTSFGGKVEPPALSCRNDVVVDNGAAAPKLCLPTLEMRTTTAAGGLLPTGEISTATRTTLDYSTLWFCQTEETHSERTSIPSAWYDSTFQRKNCLLPPPAGGSLRQNPGKI